jgi:ribonuclease BN (tRNA processing enzyme)
LRIQAAAAANVKGVEVTVVGKSCSWPDAEGASSGYLITEQDFRLLLDCGTGVFAKLRSHCDYGLVDAIVISHLHADHFLDLIPYSFALLYSPAAPHPRPALYGPPGMIEMTRAIGQAIGFGDQLERAFVLREFDCAAALALGPLNLEFQEVPHFIQTFACRIVGASGSSFTYGADCRYNEVLVELAQGTDLLLVEATAGGARSEPDPDGTGGHMTAREAGTLARRADARRVLISHFSDELDRGLLRSEAELGFGGVVELAAEGRSFVI